MCGNGSALDPTFYPEEIYTHPFNGLLSGTTQVSRYQKGKTNLDFTEARDSKWQLHQLGRMQVCTSLQTDDHASTPPLSKRNSYKNHNLLHREHRHRGRVVSATRRRPGCLELLRQQLPLSPTLPLVAVRASLLVAPTPGP